MERTDSAPNRWLSASLSMDRRYLERRVGTPHTTTPAVLPHRMRPNQRRWRNNWGRALTCCSFHSLILCLALNTRFTRPRRATVVIHRFVSLGSSSLGLPTCAAQAQRLVWVCVSLSFFSKQAGPVVSRFPLESLSASTCSPVSLWQQCRTHPNVVQVQLEAEKFPSSELPVPRTGKIPCTHDMQVALSCSLTSQHQKQTRVGFNRLQLNECSFNGFLSGAICDNHKTTDSVGSKLQHKRFQSQSQWVLAPSS